MSNINSSKFRKPDYVGPTQSGGLYASVALAAFDKTVITPQVLFPEVEYGSVQERFVYNPNAAGNITIRIRSTPSAPAVTANGDDTISLAPGTGWSSSCINQIDVLMPNGTSNITYGVR